MASDSFTGTAATALATHNAAWKPISSTDGVTGAELDGSGHVRCTAFKDVYFYFDDGTTGANDYSEIIIPVGSTFNVATTIMGPLCRAGSANIGYQLKIQSSTNVNTNVNTVGFYRNGGTVIATWTPTPVDNSALAITVRVQVVNTVDILATFNGQTHTFSGSGGNDASGSAVLTGGFPGAFIHWNSSGVSSPGGTIDNWTNGAAAAANAPQFMLLGVG